MTWNKTRWTRLALGFVGGLALLGMQSKSNAGVIYNSGAPDQVSGNEMSAWIQANEFTLSSSENITGVKFWDIEIAGAYNGSITWSIYNNASGSPGSVVYTGNTSGVSRTSTGNVVFGDLDEFVNTFSISESLGAGTYWLGLHNGPLSDQNRNDLYWETTSNPSQPDGYELPAPFTGSWDGNGQAHAFELLSGGATVPLPASVWGGLALLGGIGLMHIRRKSVAW